MRWTNEANYHSYQRHTKHDLASYQNNIDHPGLESLEEAWSSIVSIMLPNLDSILLEIVLDAPVGAFGFCFLILKTEANGLLIG